MTSLDGIQMYSRFNNKFFDSIIKVISKGNLSSELIELVEKIHEGIKDNRQGQIKVSWNDITVKRDDLFRQSGLRRRSMSLGRRLSNVHNTTLQKKIIKQTSVDFTRRSDTDTDISSIQSYGSSGISKWEIVCKYLDEHIEFTEKNDIVLNFSTLHKLIYVLNDCGVYYDDWFETYLDHVRINNIRMVAFCKKGYKPVDVVEAFRKNDKMFENTVILKWLETNKKKIKVNASDYPEDSVIPGNILSVIKKNPTISLLYDELIKSILAKKNMETVENNTLTEIKKKMLRLPMNQRQSICKSVSTTNRPHSARIRGGTLKIQRLQKKQTYKK